MSTINEREIIQNEWENKTQIKVFNVNEAYGMVSNWDDSYVRYLENEVMHLRERARENTKERFRDMVAKNG